MLCNFERPHWVVNGLGDKEAHGRQKVALSMTKIPKTRNGRPLTSREIRQREQRATATRGNFSVNGPTFGPSNVASALDGAVRILVADGRALTPEGAALKRHYERTPPQAAEAAPRVYGRKAVKR